MSETLRIRLWLAWIGILIFVVGQVAYNALFYSNVSTEILDAYAKIDAQLSWQANLGKYLFGISEMLCFVIVTYILREIAIKDLALNIAYCLFFFLAMAALAKALVGTYYLYVGIKIEIAYVVSGIIISSIEYYRGKHS